MTTAEPKAAERKTALEQWRELQAKKAQTCPPCPDCSRPMAAINQNEQGEKFGRPELDGLTFGADAQGAVYLRGRCRKCRKLQQINPAQLLKQAAA